MLYIVMPAYNESENIEFVIKQWYPIIEKLNNGSKLLIVNDGSKDDTFDKLCVFLKKYPLLLAIDKVNSGHGATILFGYRKCIEMGAEYIFQTDSDGQTNPEEFWQFWQNRNVYDFQIGYRKGRQDGFGRIIVTKMLRFVIWFMFHEWVVDANTPFRLMKAERLKIVMEKIPENFFLANVAISAISLKQKEKCKWYPITFKPRQGGVNSINFKRIVKIGWRAIFEFKDLYKSL